MVSMGVLKSVSLGTTAPGGERVRRFTLTSRRWKIFAHGPVSDVQNQHTRLAVAIHVSDDLAPASHGKALAIA